MAEVEPVSSSAQLVLLPWLLGWEEPANRTTFAAALHAGSCLGIAWVLRDELRALRRREVLVLAAVSAPAAVAGLLAADVVEERLGRPPQLAALLAGAGALMWWVDARAAVSTPARLPRASRMITSDPRGAARVIMGLGGGSDVPDRRGGVTGRAATVASLAQVAALVPGVSRSGATLTALRACGTDRAAAERFTLLMSLPVTAGAAALTLARADRAALQAMAPGLVAGAGAAAVAAAGAASRHRARPGRPPAAAALYRLVLAAVVARRLRQRRDRT